MFKKATKAAIEQAKEVVYEDVKTTLDRYIPERLRTIIKVAAVCGLIGALINTPQTRKVVRYYVQYH